MSDPRGAGEGSPQAQPKGGTNGWAIASLVTGIVGFFPLALIFGYVALSQIKKDPSIGGRGFAVAGVVLGWIQVGLVLVLILFIVSFASVTG